MKVALLNQDERSFNGGDSVQLRGYQKALRNLGHQADYYWGLNPDLTGYDEAWLFHINFGWTVYHYEQAISAGVPYRVFAIFYPGMYSNTDHDKMAVILSGAKRVYALSDIEKSELIKEFGEMWIDVIPNGVDKSMFYKFESDLLREGVISAGRDGKNHEAVANACIKIGAQHAIITGRPHIEMPVIYNRAKVLVSASLDDRSGLTIFEGAACGCGIVNSKFVWGNWQVPSPIVDPNDIDALAAAIKSELDCPRDYRNYVLDWKDIMIKILQ